MMRVSVEAPLDSPAMSAYSERDPPSENGFSLPPISLKLTPSPSNTSDMSYDDEEPDRLQLEPPSSYSSRASTFMFSRRSSRLSSLSNGNSPTKFPVIDRSKSNSVASLNSSRASMARRSFREVKTDRIDRGSLCKSPSCPALQWDEYEESAAGSINGDIQPSMHPSTVKQYGGDAMHLPDIFCSANKNQQQVKRDSSLPPLANGNEPITPRLEPQRERGRKGRRNSLTTDGANHVTSGDTNGAVTRVDSNTTCVGGGGFLVPITESDKVTAKQKIKKKNKVSPKPNQLREYGDPADRLMNGISGLLQIEGEAVPNSQGERWDIKEEDETMETESICSYDESQAIDEIAKENKVLTDNSSNENKTKKSGSKNKKQR